MAHLAERDAGLDFIGSEITAAPDDIAIPPPLQAFFDGCAALRLPLAIVTVHLFETSDGVTLAAEPRDLFGREIGVYDDAALVFAVADDDDTEFGPERAQVTTVTPGDGDVIDGHLSSPGSVHNVENTRLAGMPHGGIANTRIAMKHLRILNILRS